MENNRINQNNAGKIKEHVAETHSPVFFRSNTAYYGRDFIPTSYMPHKNIIWSHNDTQDIVPGIYHFQVCGTGIVLSGDEFVDAVEHVPVFDEEDIDDTHGTWFILLKKDENSEVLTFADRVKFKKLDEMAQQALAKGVIKHEVPHGRSLLSKIGRMEILHQGWLRVLERNTNTHCLTYEIIGFSEDTFWDDLFDFSEKHDSCDL